MLMSNEAPYVKFMDVIGHEIVRQEEKKHKYRLGNFNVPQSYILCAHLQVLGSLIS